MLTAGRDQRSVRNQVVHAGRARRTWVTQVIHLQRGGAHGKDSGPAAVSKSLQVHCDIDFQIPDKQCHALIGKAGHIDDVTGSQQAGSHGVI